MPAEFVLVEERCFARQLKDDGHRGPTERAEQIVKSRGRAVSLEIDVQQAAGAIIEHSVHLPAGPLICGRDPNERAVRLTVHPRQSIEGLGRLLKTDWKGNSECRGDNPEGRIFTVTQPHGFCGRCIRRAGVYGAVKAVKRTSGHAHSPTEED